MLLEQIEARLAAYAKTHKKALTKLKVVAGGASSAALAIALPEPLEAPRLSVVPEPEVRFDKYVGPNDKGITVGVKLGASIDKKLRKQAKAFGVSAKEMSYMLIQLGLKVLES